MHITIDGVTGYFLNEMFLGLDQVYPKSYLIFVPTTQLAVVYFFERVYFSA